MGLLPGSLSPPALPSPTTTSGLPEWILLDLDAYIAGGRNATTASATLHDGRTLEVPFQAAAPPAVSHLCIRFLGSRSDATDFGYEPRVVGAAGRFVLIRIRFASSYDRDELFMYGGDPESPTLERVPLPSDYRLPLYKAFGIAPRGDGGHYLIAAYGLADADITSNKYRFQLCIYSSEDRAWSIKPLPDTCSGAGVTTQKLITSGDGVLGWVDFHQGVTVCDLFRESVDFFPFPQPMPDNRAMLKEFHPGNPAFRIRDVAVSNDGVIKFVEMEYRWIVTTIVPEKPVDPSEMDVLYDSDLIVLQERLGDMDDKPRQVRRGDGWRVVTWTRTILSNCWHKGRVVDVDDISVDDAIFSSLVSELGMAENDAKSLKFRNLYSAFPTLSTDGDDLLYLKTVVNPNDMKGCVVAVDLGEKKLKAFAPYDFERHDPVKYAYHPCSLSKHLNMTSVADLCQITKTKDSTDPLDVQQSEAEEAQKAYEAQTGLQEDLSGGCNTKNNQAFCDQRSVLPTRKTCPPPRPRQPNINQPKGIAVNIQHVAKSTAGSCLPQSPQPKTDFWSRVANHLYPHGVNQNHQLNNEAGYYRPPNIVQNLHWPNVQGYSTIPGHLPGHAGVQQPGILPAGPSPLHAGVHRPDILPTPAAHHHRGEAFEQWPPGSGGSAPPPPWTTRKRTRGSD